MNFIRVDHVLNILQLNKKFEKNIQSLQLDTNRLKITKAFELQN